MPTDTLLAIPSDSHSGSTVGLLPPGQWVFEGGGYHDPDEAQRILTRLWVTAWERIGKARKGKRLIVVHNGDAVEGSHHNAKEVITPRIGEHERIHKAAMLLALKIAGFNHKRGDRLYYVKGTPAHVQTGGESEEKIARDLIGAVPKIKPADPEGQDGRYLWDRLRLDINGKLFDIAHHGAGVGLKPWTRSNPLRAKLQEAYYRALENRTRPPDYWIRSHRHVKAHDVYISNTGHRIEGFITPAMQNKTEFGYKVAADLPASLGVIWFTVSAGGSVEYQHESIEVDTDEVITL